MQNSAKIYGEPRGDKSIALRVGFALLIFLVGVLIATYALATDYVIGEGDTLSIAVWGEKAFTLDVKVRPDGKVTMPAIGELMAANMTPNGLQLALTEKLSSVLKKPIVTVAVTEIMNNKVYVIGSGVKSGIFTLDQRTTLLQLLCQIENVQKADLKRAYVIRGHKKIREDFTSLLINGNTEEDIVIEPNDIISIPMNLNKNIYVVGAVNMPKFIEYREGITVMEAILEAGGFTKFASPNDTIIRRKDNNKEVAISVKAKRLMFDGDMSQNVLLKPGDYVIIKEGIF